MDLMRATYTRLFPDSSGVLHFEEVEVEMLPGFAAPPAAPLHVAEFITLGQCRWVGGEAGWNGGIPHPVPRRMLVIPISGEFEVTAGDGSTRTFGPGHVILAEDTWGTGHSNLISIESICLFIELG
jgi:hypothetical protein